MSLLDGTELITIKLYYKFKDVKTGKKLIIFEDNKAEELLKDQTKVNGIEVLETKWNSLTWKEYNELMAIASKGTDPISGERQFNFVTYRDNVVKRCLKNWNLIVNDKPVPVTSVNIDKLPAIVVTRLYQKFDALSTYTEDELKN